MFNRRLLVYPGGTSEPPAANKGNCIMEGYQ